MQTPPAPPSTDLRLDTDRARRTGDPEVVLAGPKSPEQVVRAVRGLLDDTTGAVIATLVEDHHLRALRAAGIAGDHDPVGRVLVARPEPLAVDAAPRLDRLVLVSGGTSDLPVVRECVATLAAFHLDVDVRMDVGVAGVHRLHAQQDALDEADVVIAVAGMEGALPTAVAGLTAAPVIAVPTSVGQGAAFEGIAALLTMLASCAPGISVVNIDSGFGAAMVARRILRVGRDR